MLKQDPHSTFWSELTSKGYARIYCENEADVAKVKAVIKELDEFEYGYLPPDLITAFSEYPELVYTHKFGDLDMNLLTAVCWSRGIKIWVLDNGLGEILANAVELDQ